MSHAPYPAFDRTRLKVRALKERVHDISLDDLLPLDAPVPEYDHPEFAMLIERIGDLAVNVAERAAALARLQPVPLPFTLDGMMSRTQEMFKKSLDCLVNRDVALAYAVCAADEQVDAMNRQAFAQTIAAVREHPERAEYLISYFSVACQLERIADYATNIAEDVIYMLEGKIVRHKPERYQPHG